jgi:hypothetical protein
VREWDPFYWTGRVRERYIEFIFSFKRTQLNKRKRQSLPREREGALYFCSSVLIQTKWEKWSFFCSVYKEQWKRDRVWDLIKHGRERRTVLWGVFLFSAFLLSTETQREWKEEQFFYVFGIWLRRNRSEEGIFFFTKLREENDSALFWVLDRLSKKRKGFLLPF